MGVFCNNSSSLLHHYNPNPLTLINTNPYPLNPTAVFSSCYLKFPRAATLPPR